jgi:hypothetical protein
MARNRLRERFRGRVKPSDRDHVNNIHVTK